MTVVSTLNPTNDPLRLLISRYAELAKRRLRAAPRSAKLAASLAFALSLLASAYGARRWQRARAAERARGQRLLRRNSGLLGGDGSRTVFVPYGPGTAKVVIHPTKPTTFDAHRRLFLNPPRAVRLGGGEAGDAGVPPPQAKPGLNLAFLHQYLSLLSIMIPRWNSKEAGLLLSQAGALALRTYLSLLVARLDGAIVRDLVAGRGRAFLWGIVQWCGIGGVAAYVNAALKFLQSKVAIAFRTRLTRYVHDLYLHDQNFYKLSDLDGGVGPGPDQFITQDLTLFCDAAAALYSSIGKPLVDLGVFSYQLFRSLGPLAFAGLFVNYVATAALLRTCSPPFGKLKAVEARREGEFRALHTRLIANAEEVAFYGGADVERVVLDRSFRALRGWMEGIYRLRVRYSMLEDFVLKYAWSAFGYLVSALPVFLPAWGGRGGRREAGPETASRAAPTRERGRMQAFVTDKRLMLALADAGGRIMYALKDLAELAGHTSRVYTLLAALHRVHAAAYPLPRGTAPEPFSLADVHGTVQRGYDGVRLEAVPIVAPALYPRGGAELVAALSFQLAPGDHLLISGPNGAGKSAVARVLAGLWPAYRGLVSRPRSAATRAADDDSEGAARGILFLPQRAYLSAGTLRDQVLYPRAALEGPDAAARDADLARALADARLGYLPAREGGWDARKDWTTVLSGGERQRMALARLFHHAPRVAVLDEATSAVSADVEGLLYERAAVGGTTLVSISTRASLKKYHRFHLSLGLDADGRGWAFERIGTEAEKLGVERELEELRARLRKVEGWERRRREIEAELAKVWVEGREEGELAPPPYVQTEGAGDEGSLGEKEGEREEESVLEQEDEVTAVE